MYHALQRTSLILGGRFIVLYRDLHFVLAAAEGIPPKTSSAVQLPWRDHQKIRELEGFDAGVNDNESG